MPVQSTVTGAADETKGYVSGEHTMRCEIIMNEWLNFN